MNKENNKISKVILNLIQDLQRLLGSFSNGVRGRCQIKFGMTSYVKGFTLLEILVAVLIIGILVAVAVPQYQKAVLKSRFSSLMPLGKALHDGNESYYLEHGQYTNDPTKLDVRANNSNAQITLGNEDKHKYVLLTRDDINNNLRIYQQRSQNFPGETHCEALTDNAQANWLCRDGLHGTYVGQKYGYHVYALNTETPTGSLGRSVYNPSTVQALGEGDTCVGTSHGACGTYKMWTFPSQSTCIGKVNETCNHGKFNDHSACIGNANFSCQSTQFTNHSVCYVHGGTACSGATYDETSCCTGNVTGYCSATSANRCSNKGIIVEDRYE